jgi:hypothetical protein
VEQQPCRQQNCLAKITAVPKISASSTFALHPMRKRLTSFDLKMRREKQALRLLKLML